MLIHDLVLKALLFAQTAELNEQTFSQISGTNADRMERLDKAEHFFKLAQRMVRILGDFFQRNLQKTQIVHVADDQFRRFPLRFADVGRVQLLPKVMLQSFLGGDRVEEKLTSLLVLSV